MPFSFKPGYHDAVTAAAACDAFRTGVHDEYSRGQAELIMVLFTADDSDPGSGEAYDHIVRDIKSHLL